jgi:uncharacterized protein DUF2062
LIAARDLSPEQVALLLPIGLVAGVFPIAGIPTLLCLPAAAGLRLNPLAMQLVNHMSTPLQWALLLPLAHAGARLCGYGPRAAGQLLALPLHAVAGWACVCVPLGIPLYFTLVFFLRRRRMPWLNRFENPG